MKKAILALSMALGAMSFSMAQDAPKWEIDPTHTDVDFTVKHFFSDVNGTFHDYSGEFYIDPENIENSKVTFQVKVNSVDTDNEKRDGHLMTDDFFNAEKFPKMSFESTGFKKKSGKKYVMIGNLTIKDVTKKVEIPFEILGVMDHPMVENAELMGLKFDYSLMRTEYNVGTGKWALTKVVGDKVDIDINMELIHKKS